MTALATAQRYPLVNAEAIATEHHRGLAELLDPFTRQRVQGLGNWPTASRCLEVGAGRGSVALWLADQVAPEGHVVAMDLAPDHIPPHPRLVPVAHDLTSSDPFPTEATGPFDLIHARLTLAFLPGPDVLQRLAGLLSAGGVLLIEDWAALPRDVVITAPTPEAAQLYERYQRTVGAVFTASGTDREWGRRIHPAMTDAGLVDVETVVHATYWVGGSAGCRVIASSMVQLRPKLLAAGLAEQELAAVTELLADPRLVVHGHPLYSTSGRRG